MRLFGKNVSNFPLCSSGGEQHVRGLNGSRYVADSFLQLLYAQCVQASMYLFLKSGLHKMWLLQWNHTQIVWQTAKSKDSILMDTKSSQWLSHNYFFACFELFLFALLTKTNALNHRGETGCVKHYSALFWWLFNTPFSLRDCLMVVNCWCKNASLSAISSHFL